MESASPDLKNLLLQNWIISPSIWIVKTSENLVDIIKFCNNKLFKSGEALSTGAIIQYANQYVNSGQSWV